LEGVGLGIGAGYSGFAGENRGKKEIGELGRGRAVVGVYPETIIAGGKCRSFVRGRGRVDQKKNSG